MRRAQAKPRGGSSKPVPPESPLECIEDMLPLRKTEQSMNRNMSVKSQVLTAPALRYCCLRAGLHVGPELTCVPFSSTKP